MIRMNMHACEKMSVHLVMAVLPTHVQGLLLCQSHRDSPSVPYATVCTRTGISRFFYHGCNLVSCDTLN